MLISELVNYYKLASNEMKIVVPFDSALGKTALEIQDMVTSYAGDAQIFLDSGDLVNAFAASAYGFGWIDGGLYLGYVSGMESRQILLEKAFPDELMEKLEEKTYRYQRMLKEAVSSVSFAPDEGTSLYQYSQRILKIANKSIKIGSNYLPNNLVNALVEFSYGYGWLDCGVRCGLFAIHGNRHLFTI